MNRERARELLPIIQAFAEGEDIQYRVPDDKECGTDKWTNFIMPKISLRDHVEYRIKPKPREWILKIRRNDNGTDDFYVQPPSKVLDDGGMAFAYSRGCWDEVIKVQEVES